MTSFPVLPFSHSESIQSKLKKSLNRLGYSPSDWSFQSFQSFQFIAIITCIFISTIIFVSLKSKTTASWRAIPISIHKEWYPDNRASWKPADYPHEYSHQQIIYTMSSCISTVLNKNGVPLSIFFGNLLEMVRTGRFSTDYDHDADFVMHYSDYDKLKSVRETLEDTCGLYMILRHMTLEFPNTDEYVFRQPVARIYWSRSQPFFLLKKPFYVDIWGAKKLPSENDFQFWGFDNNKYHYEPVTLERIGLPCPMPHTDDLSSFTCPNNIITSLDNRYGKDWIEFPCKKMLQPSLALISEKDPKLAAKCRSSSTCKDSILSVACSALENRIEGFMKTYPLGREALIRYQKSN